MTTNFFNIVLNCITADWVTAISTFLLVLLTIVIAYFARNTLYDAKKALFGSTVSNSRPPYLETLRKSFSQLHAELVKKTIDIDKFNAAFYWVTYHFNEHEGMNIDGPFIAFLNIKILQKINSGEPIENMTIEDYRKYTSAILQYEWDNFKEEINLGRKLVQDEKKVTKEKTIGAAIKSFSK